MSKEFDDLVMSIYKVMRDSLEEKWNTERRARLELYSAIKGLQYLRGDIKKSARAYEMQLVAKKVDFGKPPIMAAIDAQRRMNDISDILNSAK